MYQFFVDIPIYDSVTEETVINNLCPFFLKGIVSVLLKNGIDPATAYATSDAANGCSVVSPSPRTAPVRIFAKAYLMVTKAQWDILKMPGPLGLPTASFVNESRTMCDTKMSFMPAGEFDAADCVPTSTGRRQLLRFYPPPPAAPCKGQYYACNTLPALCKTLVRPICKLDIFAAR